MHTKENWFLFLPHSVDWFVQFYHDRGKLWWFRDFSKTWSFTVISIHHGGLKPSDPVI